MVTKIGQIVVTCDDTDRATVFYRDKLGLTYLFSAPPSLVFFDVGGTWLMLGPHEGPQQQHRFASILYFDVDDIVKEHAAMTERGVVFRGAPRVVHREETRELWLADFVDSEGNTMCLRQWQ